MNSKHYSPAEDAPARVQEQSHGSEGNIGSQYNAADDEDHDMTDVDNFDDLMNNVDDVGSVEDEVEEGSMRYPCG